MLQELSGHRDQVCTLAFAPGPDASMLASSSFDQAVKLWDAHGTVRWWNPEQGVHLATVQAHEAWARAVRVSPDGKITASCGEDGVIKLWEMHSHQHPATLRAERPYERLDISQTRGLTNAQQAALRALGAIESFPL